MPCSDLFIYFFLTLVAKMGIKIGVRLTICVALIFKYVSYALLLFVPNYYVVLIAMCLFGIGSGLGNLTYLRNSWRYFPQSQGLVNGIILGGAGISSSVLTPLADFAIINPDKIPANKTTGLYEDEAIANRLPTYLIILSITFLILGVISIFITFPYQNEDNEETDKSEEQIGESPKENEKDKEALIASQAPLTNLFFSIKNLKLFSFCFCGFCK